MTFDDLVGISWPLSADVGFRTACVSESGSVILLLWSWSLLRDKVVIYPRAAIRGSRYRGDSWDPFLDEISAEQLGETVRSEFVSRRFGLLLKRPRTPKTRGRCELDEASTIGLTTT